MSLGWQTQTNNLKSIDRSQTGNFFFNYLSFELTVSSFEIEFCVLCFVFCVVNCELRKVVMKSPLGDLGVKSSIINHQSSIVNRQSSIVFSLLV